MSEVKFTPHDYFLKKRCLELAQWNAPGESLTAQDAEAPLSTIVARIAASPHTTPAQMALIAVSLADFIESPK